MPTRQRKRLRFVVKRLNVPFEWIFLYQKKTFFRFENHIPIYHTALSHG